MFNKLISKADKLLDFAVQGKREYREAINSALQKGDFSPENTKFLESLAEKNNLSSRDLFYIHKEACSLLMQKASEDFRITDKEFAALHSLVNYTGLSLHDLDLDINTLRKYHTIWQIEDLKRLPSLQATKLPIIYKKGEFLTWAAPACLKKFKKVTTSISYGGFSTSIRIAKGLRYRVGSVKVKRSTEEVVDIEDSGVFWLTNQRIGFVGRKKNFTILYNKVFSFDLNSIGLFLRKEGRESPYIIGMDDYEVPCTIISFILNEEDANPTTSRQLASGSLRCPHCNAIIESSWKYCPSCTKPINSQCPYCGIKTEPNWKFCVSCSKPLQTP